MNAVAGAFPPLARPASRASWRWIHVSVAALFVLVTLAGFIPSSIGKIAAVGAGQRPPFPPILHVHAAAMGAWLLLLLTQASLATTGKRKLHRALGLAGAVLLPVIVASGVMLLVATWRMIWSPATAAAMPPAALAETKTFLSNILMVQGRALVGFLGFIGWALLVRRRDPESHRQLMFLGTAIPLVAGSDRLTTSLGWTTMPASPLALDILMVLSVLPLLVHDLARHRRLHHTTVVWIAVNLPLAIATNLLWNTPWWLATAPRLMGAA